jgi:hypothetical protein
MRGVKFVSVFALLALWLSAGTGIVMAKEAPPGEYVKEAREELTSEEMADLLDLDEEPKYEGISVGFEVSADGTFKIKSPLMLALAGYVFVHPLGLAK